MLATFQFWRRLVVDGETLEVLERFGHWSALVKFADPGRT
jgi:hypothetical protein